MIAADGTAHKQIISDARAIALIAMTRTVMLNVLHARLDEGPVMSNDRAVADYAQARLGHAPVETVLLLLLNDQNELIRDLCLSTGTVDATAIAPREVVRHILNANARAILLAHNHPSGDPTPSLADKAITNRIARVVEGLGVTLVDHVIVARGRWHSMRADGVF
ncbi:JAB domain-containing protein [Sphingomonas cavernae]|uniref:JAB domain-containing protein n=1 Tax=Sphingomonas cavernae TaxID=2320861 RepID=UPI001600D12D|nr:JAB domain-containing protein [Sphingomonas cavernae]